MVYISATFTLESIWAKLMILAAIASLALWYAMALCFFFNIEDGKVVFKIMLMLSPINREVSSSELLTF